MQPRNATPRTKYTFKGRDRGRYVWSSDKGDMCCGVKFFWEPEKAAQKTRLPRLQKENALAASLWSAPIGNDVRQVAVTQLEELEKMGYTIIKRRKR